MARGGWLARSTTTAGDHPRRIELGYEPEIRHKSFPSRRWHLVVRFLFHVGGPRYSKEREGIGESRRWGITEEKDRERRERERVEERARVTIFPNLSDIGAEAREREGRVSCKKRTRILAALGRFTPLHLIITLDPSARVSSLTLNSICSRYYLSQSRTTVTE